MAKDSIIVTAGPFWVDWNRVPLPPDKPGSLPPVGFYPSNGGVFPIPLPPVTQPQPQPQPEPQPEPEPELEEDDIPEVVVTEPTPTTTPQVSFTAASVPFFTGAFAGGAPAPARTPKRVPRRRSRPAPRPKRRTTPRTKPRPGRIPKWVPKIGRAAARIGRVLNPLSFFALLLDPTDLGDDDFGYDSDLLGVPYEDANRDRQRLPGIGRLPFTGDDAQVVTVVGRPVPRPQPFPLPLAPPAFVPGLNAPGVFPGPLGSPLTLPSPNPAPVTSPRPRPLPNPSTRPGGSPGPGGGVGTGPKPAAPIIPLTGFQPQPLPLPNPEAANPCKSPKKQKKKREPRSVCYRGTYTEKANGLIKHRKEKVPCQ